MTEETEDHVNEVSYLEMSDEELMNAPAPAFDASEVGEQEDKEEQGEGGDVENQQDSGESSGESEDKPAGSADPDDSAESDDDDEPGDSQGEEESAGDGEGVEQKADKEAKPAAKTEGTKDETPAKEGVVDFEAEYKRLLAPFKANGREISVKNVDDAISLMQMGANYNKKMAALKPNLKLMKMLENNGLLDEEKISFLIDLGKKNPEAINKLVADSGMDPMDLDAEKASGYKQTTYTVDEREIALDTVLGELQDSPTYNRMLDVVSNKWDAASKRIVAETPQLLKVINDHIASGAYDIISKEIESERMFGRLNGLSDIEAYRQVGDAIHARGGFDHLVQGSSQTQGKSAAASTVVAPKPKKVDDAKLKEKKRAASSTKPAAPRSTPTDFNPLAMSDEEFSKQVNSKFL